MNFGKPLQTLRVFGWRFDGFVSQLELVLLRNDLLWLLLSSRDLPAFPSVFYDGLNLYYKKIYLIQYYSRYLWALIATIHFYN